MIPFAEAKSFTVLGYQHCANSLGAGNTVHPAVNHVDLGMAGTGAPALVAIEDDAIALESGMGGEVGQGRSRIGFRHGDGNHNLTATYPRQDIVLHLFAAKVSDCQSRTKTGFENRKCHGDGNFGNFLQYQHRVQMGHASAAITGIEIYAQVAQLRKTFTQFPVWGFVTGFDLAGYFR